MILSQEPAGLNNNSWQTIGTGEARMAAYGCTESGLRYYNSEERTYISCGNWHVRPQCVCKRTVNTGSPKRCWIQYICDCLHINVPIIIKLKMQQQNIFKSFPSAQKIFSTRKTALGIVWMPLAFFSISPSSGVHLKQGLRSCSWQRTHSEDCWLGGIG